MSLFHHQGTIKDPIHEARLFVHRALWSVLILTLLLGTLLWRLVQLQVVEHGHYQTLSEENRIKLVSVPPNRGLIYDRHGVLLAENLPAYRLEIVREQVDDLDATLQALAGIVEVRPADIDRFRRQLARSRPFDGVPLRLKLSEAEVARFAVDRHRFPGVDIEAGLARHYPLGMKTAHVVGYVGRINEADQSRLEAANQLGNYRGTNYIGKVGVERAYEQTLHGQVGYQELETNAQGRDLRVLSRTAPVPGRDLHLSLDIRLQQAVEQALGEASGAAAALDVASGEVLALVSRPAFDPNPFVHGIDVETYAALRDDQDQPLFNRFLRGQYPPGSTLKPFVGLAGLELGVVDGQDQVYCPGFYTLPGSERRYRDWKRTGHGNMDLRDAVAQSCDVYFYDLARSLRIDPLHDFLAQFGLGQRTGIDLVGELPGLLPSSDWKRRRYNQPWFPGETLISGIGQGYNLTTPLQLAVATAVLARRGERLVPNIVHATGGPDGLQTLSHPRLPPVQVSDPGYWDQIIEAMVEVVHGPRGTARRIGEGLGYHIAGKTGTAQVFGLAEEEEYKAEELAKRLRDHALFIAFAPADAPRIALSVVVENGGSGGAVAAPIAGAIIAAYFKLTSPDPATPAAPGEPPSP